VSATQRGKTGGGWVRDAAARLGQQAAVWARPTRKMAGAGEVGRVLAGRDELWAKNRKKMFFLFFFFSNFFKTNFQKIFKSKFEFDQTTHLKNLNATT
jgi:hypothetical protein